MTLPIRSVSAFWRLALGATLTALVGLPLSAAGTGPTHPRPIPRDRTVVRQPATVPPCQQGPLIIPPCPQNTVLVIFDAPVYDENGIFVVCLEKVHFCIPEGLQPEG